MSGLRRLVFSRGGSTHAFLVSGKCILTLHTDAINLHALGPLEVERASDVEFDNETQLWKGVVRHKFRTPGHHYEYSASTRQEVLDWEKQYFDYDYKPQEPA